MTKSRTCRRFEIENTQIETTGQKCSLHKLLEGGRNKEFFRNSWLRWIFRSLRAIEEIKKSLGALSKGEKRDWKKVGGVKMQKLINIVLNRPTAKQPPASRLGASGRPPEGWVRCARWWWSFWGFQLAEIGLDATGINGWKWRRNLAGFFEAFIARCRAAKWIRMLA